MSREIKFRAWKKHNGKMRRCVYTPVSFMHYVQTHFDEPVMKHSGENNIRNFMPDADIIEQYIGLEDRNGKEIYEGDIVRLYGRFISAISWQDGYCGFRWYNNSGDGYCSLSKDNEEYYEVIGNIHENPELLGVENE